MPGSFQPAGERTAYVSVSDDSDLRCHVGAPSQRRIPFQRALAASLQGRAIFGSPVLAETVPWSGRSSSDCLADAMESVRLSVRVRVPSEEGYAKYYDGKTVNVPASIVTVSART